MRDAVEYNGKAVRAGHSNMWLTVRGKSRLQCSHEGGIVWRKVSMCDSSVTDAETCEVDFMTAMCWVRRRPREG